MENLDPRNRTRMRVLVFAGITIVTLLLLAAGLSQVEMLPGEPLPLGGKPGMDQGQFGSLPGGETIILVIRAIFTLSIILLPVFIIYLIVSPQARKQFFRQLLRIAPFVLFLILGARLIQRLGLMRGEPLGLGEGGGQEELLPLAPPLEFSANPPEWVVLAVSLGLALLLAALAGLAVWFYLRRRRAEQPLKRIAIEAQTALDALQSGGDLKNIVIRCYFEMSRVIREQRGIQRDKDMTPREFEMELERRGLPREPVQKLTRVFEEVRYGTKEPGEREKFLATISLSEIVEACRSEG